jgi:hypothetical protein
VLVLDVHATHAAHAVLVLDVHAVLALDVHATHAAHAVLALDVHLKASAAWDA